MKYVHVSNIDQHFYVIFISGKVAQPFVSIYSASKFALDGFFSGLRQELKMRDCDISITLCILGFIGKFYEYNRDI